jgi:hypothetical protein
MKTNLIIGASYNYSYEQIKYWINSINKSGFDGHKVLILFDGTTELVEKVQEQGFVVNNIPMDKNMAVHVLRFLSIYDFIHQNEDLYENVITTDVRDVVFQYDPIEWLNNNFSDTEKLVVSSECLRYKDEPWGNNNLLETYGPFIHERFKDNIIFNVGILAGKASYIKDLCLSIVLNSINRPIKICDQAVFNVTIQNEIYKQNTFYAKLNDAWAANLGTLADQSKMHYFRPNLLEFEPVFVNDEVRTSNNKKICVVHQYDRTPWRTRLEEIYG